MAQVNMMEALAMTPNDAIKVSQTLRPFGCKVFFKHGEMIATNSLVFRRFRARPLYT